MGPLPIDPAVPAKLAEQAPFVVLLGIFAGLALRHFTASIRGMQREHAASVQAMQGEHAAAVREMQGTFLGFLGALEDRREREEAERSRQVEDAYKRVQETLDASNKALGQSSAALVTNAEATHRAVGALKEHERREDERRKSERRAPAAEAGA